MQQCRIWNLLFPNCARRQKTCSRMSVHAHTQTHTATHNVAMDTFYRCQAPITTFNLLQTLQFNIHRHKRRAPIFKGEHLKINVFWDVMSRQWPINVFWDVMSRQWPIMCSEMWCHVNGRLMCSEKWCHVNGRLMCSEMWCHVNGRLMCSEMWCHVNGRLMCSEMWCHVNGRLMCSEMWCHVNGRLICSEMWCHVNGQWFLTFQRIWAPSPSSCQEALMVTSPLRVKQSKKALWPP
jgi:hypothetical protein